MDEAEILENAFNLLFAFDEVVALGYRESVNLAQIRWASHISTLSKWGNALVTCGDICSCTGILTYEGISYGCYTLTPTQLTSTP